MFKQFFRALTVQRENERLGREYRDLIHQEAVMGGELFGPVPPTVRREFFCLDEHTWVWHEEWTDAKGQRQIVTTRYDVRPNGILKAQNNHSYQQISDDEAKNLLQAARKYLQRARSDIYHIA